jgi:hypothetical protein
MFIDSAHKRPTSYSILIVFLLCSCHFTKAETTGIRILASQGDFDPGYSYFVELTLLVLSKNNHLYSNNTLKFMGSKNATQDRSLALLDDDYVDIVMSGTDAKRESRYLPIRIPLFRGLLGYRVLLIRQEDTEKFLQIKTAKQLKKLNACQGAHWPDSDILEANGYLVSRVMHFNSMFKMLVRKRCDYFPRAIYEGYSEQKEAVKSFPNITLVDDLILHYDFPLYYFVEKSNTALAKRLESGLMAALADGSWMELMKAHQVSKHLFPLTKWENKRYFELSSAVLGSELPLKNKQLWLNLQTNKY